VSGVVIAVFMSERVKGGLKKTGCLMHVAF